ncbi:hypothetical protein [Chryseobacterium indologenes]|jgi:hypothetical protein|uniref:hypothetical protein n=1 Tax=Chryseobacterium indologenes TaxID=253 RepID=UPI00068B8975|nr:hypothetical protein [Chryseobacterium indologenes]
MKKILLGIVLMLSGYFVQAQIGTNQNVENTLSNSNFFMDASKFNNYANSIGKGLGFPRVDLTKFKFDVSVINNVQILSDFDGMMVYNYGSGSTMLNEGQQVAVTPGFYYFSNPAASGTISNGKWVRLLTDIKSVVSDLKIPTNVLYARGTSTSWKAGSNTRNPLWFDVTDHINNEYITRVNQEKFLINKGGLYTFDVRANFSDIPERAVSFTFDASGTGFTQALQNTLKLFAKAIQMTADYGSSTSGVALGLDAGVQSLSFAGSRFLESKGYTFIATTIKLNPGDTFNLSTVMAKPGYYREAGCYISVMYTPIP